MRLGDDVDTLEKVVQAGAGESIILVQAAFFRLNQTDSFEDGEVLRYGRDVGSYQVGEIADTAFPFGQSFDDQDTRRVGECLNHLGASLGSLPGSSVAHYLVILPNSRESQI